MRLVLAANPIDGESYAEAVFSCTRCGIGEAHVIVAKTKTYHNSSTINSGWVVASTGDICPRCVKEGIHPADRTEGSKN